MQLIRLNDDTAIRATRALLAGHRGSEIAGLKDAKQVAAAWRALIGSDVTVTTEITDGDIARATLIWLAQDPTQAKAIEGIISGLPPANGGRKLGLAPMAVVVLLLKYNGVIEYKDKKWRFKLALEEMEGRPLGKMLDLFSKYLFPSG